MNGSTSDERGTYSYGDSALGAPVRFELDPESKPVTVGSKVLLVYPEGDVDVVEVLHLSHAQVVVQDASGKVLSVCHEDIGLGVNDDLTFVLQDGCTTFAHKEATTRRLFTPSYPRLFAAVGPRCDKITHRSGRVSLQCVRRTHGSEVNHLMDVMDRDAKPGFLARTEDNLIVEAISALDNGDPSPMRELVASGVIPTDAPVALRAASMGGHHDVDPTCSCQPCILGTEAQRLLQLQRVGVVDEQGRESSVDTDLAWELAQSRLRTSADEMLARGEIAAGLDLLDAADRSASDRS